MPASMAKRAAIYLRVSSEEQTYENQRPEVKRLARTRGYKIVAWYEEQVRASKARPEFTRMMQDAHQGRFDVLVVWALDRFGRSLVAFPCGRRPRRGRRGAAQEASGDR
jgi:DNA invertase Pin-like site-specific DNA recombinase